MKAIGHGKRSETSAADALTVAQASTPVATAILPSDNALAGTKVAVAAADYGRDPIIGILAGSTHTSLTIEREDASLGTIKVHVPRLGYSLASV